jgi:hypothetical protein
MAKALALTDDVLNEAPTVPKAAQVQRVEAAAPVEEKVVFTPPIKREPLQVRWPSEDVKAVKLATIQMDYSTVSDFMLTCFHAFMESRAAQKLNEANKK